jgi:hypothetical protein
MAEMVQQSRVKGLRELFGRFVTSKAAYKHPLLGFFHDLREAQLPAVVFGGTLRDLVVKGSSEQPRDVDVVVDTPSLSAIESLFRQYIKKQTRFGGLHLNVGLWPIDIWPLPCTWALRDREPAGVTFADLPNTTFLDVEAVAAEIWPSSGRQRQVFGQRFFSAIESRTVGINHAENPFPELCVVRALLTAARLNFRLSNGLVEYVVAAGAEMTPRDLEVVQTAHYGKVRCEGRIMRSWIDFLGSEVGKGDGSVRLPVAKPLQLAFWQDWDPSC